MRAVSRLILSAVILIITGLLAAVAVYMPEMFFSFYRDFSRDVLTILSRITGVFPFALWEFVLALIVLLALQGLIRNREFFTWLSGIVLLVSIMVFLFVGLWGLNHFDPLSVADQVDLDVNVYTEDQLAATTRYMADQAGRWADQVPRDETGAMITDFDGWAKLANKGYEMLAADNSFFENSGAPVKRLLSGRLFSYMGFTGIFIAYTAECNVNPETFSASMPYTMCHELAHRLPVAAEDEANYCAFLACKENPDPAFQYSCWYSAFIYTYNALYEVNRDAAAAIWNSMSETVREDCRRANTHYDQFEGQVQEAANKANDVYLKVFKEESGVRSYGEVADFLIAWYLREAA